MAALLLDNKFFSQYWGTASKSGVITIQAGLEAQGHPVVNMFDHNAGTSFKIGSGAQLEVEFYFGPTSTAFNGFAVYGHNLNTSQGIKVEYNTFVSAGSTMSDFTDSGSIYTNTYYPDAAGKAFGAYLGEFINARRIKITTVGWDTDSYISIMSAGVWLDYNVNISAPFTPPLTSLTEQMIKRNNNGNPLLNQVRKTPSKLSINLAPYEIDDLTTVVDSEFNTDIRGQQIRTGFSDYISYFASQYPFFVMYDLGLSSDSDSVKADKRNRIYYATIDKTVSQPRYSSPTTLNWRIPAIGYIE